jgi:hypothetical protein
LDHEKNPTDLDEEIMIYLTSIINKYGIFNYRELNLEILKNLTFKNFEDYLENLFTNIVKSNRYHVILNKDKLD